MGRGLVGKVKVRFSFYIEEPVPRLQTSRTGLEVLNRGFLIGGLSSKVVIGGRGFLDSDISLCYNCVTEVITTSSPKPAPEVLNRGFLIGD